MINTYVDFLDPGRPFPTNDLSIGETNEHTVLHTGVQGKSSQAGGWAWLPVSEVAASLGLGSIATTFRQSVTAYPKKSARLRTPNATKAASEGKNDLIAKGSQRLLDVVRGKPSYPALSATFGRKINLRFKEGRKQMRGESGCGEFFVVISTNRPKA